MSSIWSRLINLAGNITGVLPLANGGTNKALTAVNGGLVWSDADSLEITAAGTAGQKAVSAGAAAPVWTGLAQYNVDVGNASSIPAAANTNLLGDTRISTVSATVTMTIATPAVVTYTTHGLLTGDKLYFTTTGALPTGVSANTTYYAVKVNDDSFNLATTLANAAAGTKVNTTGSQSGVHTIFTGGARNTTDYVTNIGSAVAINTVTYTTITSINLAAGTWLLGFSCTAAAAASVTSMGAGISTATNLATGWVDGSNAGYAASTAAISGSVSIWSFPVTITTATTYFLTAFCAGANTTATGRFTAIRVAN